MRVVVEPGGAHTLLVENEQGRGRMTTLFASPRLFIATVDFNLEICPILVNAQEVRGGWITLDYCQEGRCEVAMPGESAIIVKPGDCCLSASRRLPSEYRYPLGRYRGIKLCFSDGVTNEPAYGVMREAGFSFGSWIEQLDPAVLFEGDDQLNALMASFEALVDPFDAPRGKLRFMEVLLHVKARGLPTGRRHSYYTKSHMRIARTTHDRLCADLGCDYRLRDIADSFGISVTSLNNYFQGVYGVPVPTYLRERRLQEAAKLLEVTDESVATIAARVGYANPSKFSAAFKRRYNATPREYRTERR